MNLLQDQTASNEFIEGELSEEDLIKIAGGALTQAYVDEGLRYGALRVDEQGSVFNVHTGVNLGVVEN